MNAENQKKISEKLSPEIAFWIICGIATMLFLAATLSCLFTLRTNGSEFEANPHSSRDTVQAFAYSLAYNKLDYIKTYVSHDKWEFIDSWSTRHKPVSPDCKDPDAVILGPSASHSSDPKDQSRLNYNFVFNQECPNYDYTFSVTGVLVDFVDNKWQISDWDKICEEMIKHVIEEQCY